MIIIDKALYMAGEQFPKEALQYHANTINGIHVHCDYL